MDNNTYKEILKNAPYGIFISDSNGNYLEVNDTACKISGYKQSELIGTSIFSIIDDEDKKTAKEKFEELRESLSTSVLLKFVHKNGDTRICNVKAVKLNKNSYIGFTEDVTEKKRLEDKIKYERDRAAKYFETANIIFIVLDRYGFVQDINDKGIKILDSKKENIIGESWLEHYVPESDRQKVQGVIDKINNGELSNVEFCENKIVNAKGEERLVSWQNNIMKNQKGETEFIISAGEDITDRKKAEEALTLSEEKFRHVFENSPVPKSITYVSNGLYVNDAFCKMTGYTKEELLREKWQDITHSEDIELSQREVDKLILGKDEKTSFRKRYVRKDGSIIWADVHTTLSRNNKGDPVYFITVANDITEKLFAEKKLRENEERLRKMFDRSNAIMLLINPKNGKITFANQAASDFYGWSKEELEKKYIYDINTLSKKEIDIEMDRACTEERSRFNFKHKLRSGEIADVIVDSAKIEIGKEILLFSIIHDDTQRLASENALSESEARYKALFEHSGVETKYLSGDGKIISVNKKALESIGGDPEKFIGKSIYELFPEEEAKLYLERIKKAISTDKTQEYENNIKLPNGDKWYSSIYSKVSDDNGRVLGVQISSKDITEQKKAQSDIEYNLKLIRKAEQIGKIGFYERNWQTGEGHWSDGFFKLLGLESNRTPSHSGFLEFVIEEEREQVEAYVKSTIEKKINMDITFRIKRPDERIVYIHGNGENFYDSNGNPLSTIGLFQDITEQMESEQALRESEAKYKALFESSSIGIGYIKPDGTVISFNKRALENMGKENQDYSEKSLYEVFPENEADLYMKRIKLAMSSKVQLEYIDKEDIGNEIKWYLRKYSRVIDKNKEVIGVQIKAEDITEKKNQEIERAKLESYLRNQQKLESIGTLASGVAHEINNPINGILNYAQIIFDSNIEDKSIKEYAGEIISETERVSEIVKNLLQFSRQNKQEHSYATIEDIILKTLSLVKTVLKHDQIGLDLNLESDIPKIKCRSQQIQQVIMNLVTNARDALNEKYPNYNENKKIKISCKNNNSEGRNWIRLVVEDYGPGISKQNINKIFDPFFTTKGKFKGTGLGLSISYGIVNEHHGDITVESEEGKFTRFIVNLPCDNGWEIE